MTILIVISLALLRYNICMNNIPAADKRIPAYVGDILRLIENEGFQAYVAGGAVRDIVLGTVPHDYDVATSAKPEQTIEIFRKAGINFYDNAAKHGTVTAVTDEGDVEVTTFREDGAYSDLRRPDEVIFKSSIEEDVRRRDFTINAMYMDADGSIHDPEGGQEDCGKHLIRTVGDPVARFEEDALRILRGIRFCSRLGFDIEEETLLAMETHSEELKKISGERIASELIGIVTGKYAPQAIRTGWKVLSVVIPEIAICRGFDQRSSYHDRDVLEHTLDVLSEIPYIEGLGRDAELAMAALFHDLGKPECFKLDEDGTGHMKGHPLVSMAIAERVLTELKCSRQFISNVCLLVKLHDTYLKPDRIRVHKFMCQYPSDILNKLKILQRADILAHSPLGLERMCRLEELNKISEELIASGAVFDIKDLEIDGRDIIALGVKEGPEVGAVLSQVFYSYLEEKCPNSKELLIAEAKRLISTKSV